MLGCRIVACAVVVAALAFGFAGAAEEPHLPPSPTLIGPLHRDSQGQLNVTTPGSGNSRALCEKAALCVGKGARYATLSDALGAAAPGALIEIFGGVYHETAEIKVPRVTLRGVGGTPHIDCSGEPLAGDKACLFLAATGITLDNLEISGAARGACISDGAGTGFTLRRIYCHGSQEGVVAAGGAITIEDSQFFDNGWTRTAHNADFSGDCTLSVRGSIFRDARLGNEFTSGCRKTEISDSTFSSTQGISELDFPTGGDTLIYRSTIAKGAGSHGETIIAFTRDGCTHPGALQLKSVHISNARPIAKIRNYDRCTARPLILQDVSIDGIPPKEIGYITRR